MARRLPSLNALRSFEAAARLSSFSKAAEELFVTHAAVSRQVRELESWLATRLFVRTGRGVAPTQAAQAYQRTLTRVFDQMESATRKIARASVSELTVQVDLAFATQWLVARLGRFQAEHADIQVSLEPTYEEFDPRTTEAGIGIQYADSDEPGAAPGRTLLQVRAFPVCSPGFLEGKNIERPADLIRYPLLHEESRSWWSQWLRSLGEPPAGEIKGPFFEETHLALLAAEAGQGIALGDDALVFDAIKAGRLTKALDLSCPSGSYQLVSRAPEGSSPAMDAFCRWLGEEIDRFKSELHSPVAQSGALNA